MLDIKGLFAPTPAPFTDDGSSLSEIRLARCVRRLVEQGVEGFLVGTQAAEYSALTFSERKQLLELVSRSVPPGTQVLANATTQSTAASIDLAQHAGACGARAVVLAPPHGEYYADLEILDHFHRVSKYCHLPVVVVDPQGRLSANFEREIDVMPGVLMASALVDSDWGSAACFEEATTDEFAYKELSCVPMALFGVEWHRSCESGAFDGLRELLRIYGVARVLKSAEDWIGLELGPLRGPLQPLPKSSMEALHNVFRMAA